MNMPCGAGNQSKVGDHCAAAVAAVDDFCMTAEHLPSYIAGNVQPTTILLTQGSLNELRLVRYQEADIAVHRLA